MSDEKIEQGLYERPEGSGVWWVRWRVDKTHVKTKKVGKKAEARAFLLKMREGRRMDRLFPEVVESRKAAVGVKYAELVKLYAARTAQLRSAADANLADRIWVAEFKDLSLEHLTAASVERWRGERLADGAKPATCNRYVSRLTHLVTLAVRDGLLKANPLLALRKLSEENERSRYLLEAEERRLRAVMTLEDWELVEVALKTGLRSGEQFTLRTEDVDFESNLIRVRPEVSKNKRQRMVDMVPSVRRILLARSERAGEWLFPSSKPSAPFTAINFYRRHFQPALERAGIKDFTWHDLRHTCASRLAMAGVELIAIQQMLGHSNISTTMRYAHLCPSHRKESIHAADRKRRTVVQDEWTEALGAWVQETYATNSPAE